MFRKFKTDDKEEFIRMSKAFYATDASVHKAGEENFHKIFGLIMDNSPYAAGYMIESGGEAAGYALLSFSYSNEMGGIILWLEELYIDDKFRRAGLAGDFIEFICNEHRGKAACMELEVAMNNAGALKLYENKGFKFREYRTMIKMI